MPAAVTARMNAVPDAGGRFRIPSVGLDVPLGELSMAGGTITPPTYTSAYVVRNLGAGPSRPTSGTVFVAMHSLRGGGTGPGNYLIDARREGTSLRTGSVIELDSVAYRVTRSVLVDRDRIGDDTTVWADVPGRLVVITCMQTPSGDRPPTQNLVVEARLSR
ncbi:class F sortase [Intrasporangium mesophilum]